MKWTHGSPEECSTFSQHSDLPAPLSLRLETVLAHRLEVLDGVQNRAHPNGREKAFRGGSCSLGMPVQVAFGDRVEPSAATGEVELTR